MFKCDYKTLELSFNSLYDISDKKRPDHGEHCFLELKDKRYTAGVWYPNDDKISGKFIRGQFDDIELGEVSKWKSMDGHDLSNCLESKEIEWINIGPEIEGDHNVPIGGFKSFKDGDCPKNEQFCLLIMKDGSLSDGRWDEDAEWFESWLRPTVKKDDVWAWTALSNDFFFDKEEEWQNEQKKEEELNKKPKIDQKLFKYGTDITVYYEKALEKLKKEYPWVTMTQMLKKELWDIVPNHGRYVFGHVSKGWRGTKLVDEWTEGTTADEFVDFLCEYVKETVKDSYPETKFKYGTDIEIYLDKAYKIVKKDYRWLEKEMLKEYCRFDIKKVGGDPEFVRAYKGDSKFYVVDVRDADHFIDNAVHAYKEAALSANPVVDTYEVPHGHIDINGWNLERYRFYRLKTGDYKVTVQAGNRSTGGSRDFFITPDCFKEKSYDKFLDRYLKIVPADGFGLDKKDLISDEKLKKFLGY